MKCPYCQGSGECEETISARFRAARNDTGMTQEQVAPLLGISRGQLANLETGRTQPSMEVLMKSLEVFDRSADWMLGRISNEQ